MLATSAISALTAIRVRGARQHNLRNIDVDLPHEQLVVITGVSGSGKSSLAFDTLVAEGQRRYLESLSTYDRQFLNQLERPDVDVLEGLPPVISLDQRTSSVQPRSTLATTTELYDYVRILYARAGLAHCPTCEAAITCQSGDQIVRQILELEQRRRVMILAPLIRGRKGAHREVFERIARNGFVRMRVDGAVCDVSEPPELKVARPHTIEVIVDRIVVKEGITPRLKESIDLAIRQGDGECLVSYEDEGRWVDRLYSTEMVCPVCQTSYPELSPRLFSFNSPYGACRGCGGLGRVENASTADSELDVCPECHGHRLQPYPLAVQFAGRTIDEVTGLTVAEALDFFETQRAAAAAASEEGPTDRVRERVLPDICQRLRFLQQVGLHYPTLNRPSNSLSGGELQRARLASCLGSGLLGACYVLDEPTIGLHPRDTQRLLETLAALREQGNTVLVVEHDLDLIRHADWVVDLGPGAGAAGGRVIGAGTPQALAQTATSLTGRYLGTPDASREAFRESSVSPRGTQHTQADLFAEADSLKLTGATLHNLKSVDVEIPLHCLTCVTGVSGSGKSSLIMQTLAPELTRRLAGEAVSGESHAEQIGTGRWLTGLTGGEDLERLIVVDQTPLGRTSRSVPATYAKVWDEVRRVFAQTKSARVRGFGARRFSFNAREARCPECAGQGTQRIEMHFLPDVFVTCPRCRGDRFNPATLTVRYREHTVADVLRMRFDEAADFFENFPRLHRRLQTFVAVGLGYLQLGQPSQTLSGGEAQRVRLASELGRAADRHTLYLLDEPTTGLHAADVDCLLDALRRLVQQGHSVLVVEHNTQVMLGADWIIDLGPEGGKDGGQVIACGTPGNVMRAETATARALREAM